MTFESQLLELLREFDDAKIEYPSCPNLSDFYQWLSKRAEKEEECEHFIGAAGVCKCEAEKELKKEL